MTWTTWGVYVVTATVLAIVPGPAIFLVIAQALQGGYRKGVWAGFGILAVNALFFILSAIGLTAMLKASYELFTVVKWAGAAYLIYLGIRTFFGQGTLALESGDGTERDPSLEPGWRRKTFMRGIILQLSNPKAILFFTALLPQFIRTEKPIIFQTVVLGLSSILPELLVIVAYAVLAGQLYRVARQPRFVKTTNRVSGALLAGAGAGLAFVGDQ
jgi:homoserine/homoserine lactone efflux protein